MVGVTSDVLAAFVIAGRPLACPCFLYHGYKSQFGLRLTAGVGQFSASGAYAEEAENSGTPVAIAKPRNIKNSQLLTTNHRLLNNLAPKFRSNVTN